MTQRLLADPAAASPVSGDPAPCVALNRPAVGKQAMSGDAGAHDQQAARRAGAGSDERRIAVAHQARPRERRTGGQEVLAAVDIRTRRADRKDDPSELVVWSADRRAALAPEIDDARNRPRQIRRGIAWTRRRLGERSSLSRREGGLGCECRLRPRRNRARRFRQRALSSDHRIPCAADRASRAPSVIARRSRSNPPLHEMLRRNVCCEVRVVLFDELRERPAAAPWIASASPRNDGGGCSDHSDFSP